MKLSDKKFDELMLDDVTVHGLVKALNFNAYRDELYWRDAAGDWVRVDVFETDKLLKGEELVVDVQRNCRAVQEKVDLTFSHLALFQLVIFAVAIIYGLTASWTGTFELWLILSICVTGAFFADPTFRAHVRRRLLVWLGEEPKPKAVPDYSAQAAELAALGFVNPDEALRKAGGDKHKALELYFQ